MAGERLEVRLDPDRRQKLLAIDERRRRYVEQMASANVEDVLGPDELSRQLERTYGVTDLPLSR